MKVCSKFVYPPNNFTNNFYDLNRQLLLLLLDAIFGYIQAQRHFSLGGLGHSEDGSVGDVRMAENRVFQARCRYPVPGNIDHL